MAIMRKGTRQEFTFTRFLGNGRVDALNIATKEHHENMALTEFKADGGTEEIIRAVKATPGYEDPKESDRLVQEYRRRIQEYRRRQAGR